MKPVKGPRIKSPASTWCMLRDNQLLKMLIKNGMDEQNLSMSDLSAKSGVHYDKIRQYLKGTYTRKGVSQWELCKLAEVFGMKLSLNIEYKHD